MHDLSNASFDQWLQFTFDHDPQPIEKAWYFDSNWEYIENPCNILAHTTKLFNKPALLLKKYSMEQIEQGLWFIPSFHGYMRFVVDQSVSLNTRVLCVESIEPLYRRLFAKHSSLSMSCYMWWDSFASYCAFDDWCLSRDAVVLKKSVEVAKRLHDDNTLPDYCRESAKHGLEHLSQAGATV